APSRGLVESPRDGAVEKGEVVDVVGWALFPAAPTSRVEVRLGDELLGRARVGVDRPDLVALSENPHARVSGFNLSLDLEEHPRLSGDVVLHVSAFSADGRRHELDPVALSIAGREREPSRSEKLPPLPPVTPRGNERPGRRVLVYTHQLNLGGAQLYLMDLVRELLAQEAIAPTVVSALDGALREELEELDVPVHIAGPVSMNNHGAHLGRLEELEGWCEGREFELVLVNTVTALALPGAELASRLGVPCVWAIHESFSLGTVWGYPEPAIRAEAERALAEASAVLFEAEATRRMFERHLGEGRGHVLPYGLDLAPVDAERANFDPAAARREAGIPEDAEVALCVGTVEPRKAQLPLAQAFDLIAGRHPRAHLVFVGVGKDDYSELLTDLAERSAYRDRIHLVPITPHVQRWYGLSDLLVCASDVESLPRTVLEAMAWETPVLATGVFGLPELIEDGESGWLCEARDTTALAEGLERALSAPPEERRAIGEASRRLVAERHSLERYAGAVGTLIGQAVADSANPAKIDAAK
ncbi:MAG TPA: glycosyltransferase family 4 protein, partial [Solirubrobacterales bacterium]|nr:glycosyltransferase family 4 protein [Solirubrobacterales bacterium]